MGFCDGNAIPGGRESNLGSVINSTNCTLKKAQWTSVSTPRPPMGSWYFSFVARYILHLCVKQLKYLFLPLTQPPPTSSSKNLPDVPSTPIDPSFEFELDDNHDGNNDAGAGVSISVRYESLHDAMAIIKQADPNFLPSIDPKDSISSIVIRGLTSFIAGNQHLHHYNQPEGGPGPNIHSSLLVIFQPTAAAEDCIEEGAIKEVPSFPLGRTDQCVKHKEPPTTVTITTIS